MSQRKDEGTSGEHSARVGFPSCTLVPLVVEALAPDRKIAQHKKVAPFGAILFEET